MTESTQPQSGIWESGRRIAGTLLETVQSRIELFALEMQEERKRAVELILWTAAVAGFGLFTCALVSLTVLVVFWENGRIPALVVLCLLHGAATFWGWRILSRKLANRETLSATIEELGKDRECLR